MSIVLQEKEGNPVEIHIINQFNEIWKSQLLLLIFSILIGGEGWYWLWVDVLHVLPCVIPHQSMSLLPSLHLCQCDIWFLTHKLKIWADQSCQLHIANIWLLVLACHSLPLILHTVSPLLISHPNCFNVCCMNVNAQTCTHIKRAKSSDWSFVSSLMPATKTLPTNLKK